MKLTKSLLAVALAAATVSTSVFAVPTIKNLDNPGGVSFTGFDWSSKGQAWITGYNITSASPLGTVDAFTLQFQAAAAAISGVAPGSQAGLGSTYEYTLFATAQETATCVADIPFTGGTCDLAMLDLVSGTWSIYYDTNAGSFANYAAGTGFTDGTLLLSGTFTSATPVFAPQGATNPGNASVSPTLTGQVATTNVTYINPMLSGTQASSTLQFGSTIAPAWVRAAAFNGVATGPNTNTSFQAQADANQSFTAAVPEPHGLALAGLALAVGGIVGMRRRRD
jgi:hypothetical protein